MSCVEAHVQTLEKLDRLERQLFARTYALAHLTISGEIFDPPGAFEARGEALAQFDSEVHELLCSRETGSLLDDLAEAEQAGLLDEQRTAQLRILQRNRADRVDIPSDEAADFARLTNEGLAAWRQAKRKDDWSYFEPVLERIVETLKRFAQYRNPQADPYDVWLSEHEYGSSTELYDQLFSHIKACVVPLVSDIQARAWQPSRACIEGHFDHDAQFALIKDVLRLEGLNMDKLYVGESEHPFSESLVSSHVFVTTRIHEDDLVSSVYSTLHEGGHALYGQGGNPQYDYCSLEGGTSMGIHESQSLLFENCIGRHAAFVPHLVKLLKQHFPSQLSQLNPHDFYYAVNRSAASLIRTEADELTYPLHILIRYELEQLLFSGEAKVSDIPRLWNERYQSYLGVTPDSVSQGPLQDMHWASGMFGYFPAYTLGSAYSAQFLWAMNCDGIEFEHVLEAGDLRPILNWLGEHIWRHGRAKDPADIVLDATGSPLDARHLTRYLEDKFSAIYGLN